MTDSHEQRPKSDFLAAEEIKGILHGRERPEQERIIRWVNESLNLAVLPARATAQTPLPVSTTQPPSQSVPQPGTHTGGRAKDIRTFVEQKKPKSDIQFAAVVAYFYRFEAPSSNQKEAITSDDLREATRLAGWRRFKTPSVPLNNAVGLGYLDRAERGAFSINATGENLVAMSLPGAIGNGDGSPPAKKRKKPMKKPPRRQAKKKKAS